MKIELIYDPDCPNVDEARNNLRKAIDGTGAGYRIIEWNRAAGNAPPYAQQYGSPTVLVNGKDVANASPSGNADCCRLYTDPDTGRLRRAPSVDEIQKALSEGRKARKHATGLLPFLASIPPVAISLLPALSCPLCWPAYGAFLGSTGLGFFNYTPYLAPITILLLSLTLFGLGFRAKSRRGYGPLLLGTAAAFFLLIGRFVLNNVILLYIGIVCLIVAALWNIWPKRQCAAVPSENASSRISAPFQIGR